MKVLRIIARLNVGGPARHVVWLTRALSDEEFQSALIAGTVPPGEEDMGYFAAEHGVEPYFIPEMSRELSPKDVISLIKVYRRMRAERPDVIHTHTAKAGTVGRTAAFFYKWLTPGTLIGRPRPVRVVHTFHGHVFHSYYGGLKTKLFLAIEKALARFATDRVVVITPQQFDEINGKFRVGRGDRFSVIPLGIDLAALQPAPGDRERVRREMVASDDEVAVGFVGRLTEIKNIPLFLRSAAGALKASGGEQKLRFVIVGDGHLRASLEQEASALKIADRVCFLGNRQDIGAVYAGLDIVALTSLNEGTPLSLIEAMAAGKPVISTGVGGVVDLLGTVADQRDDFAVCERGVRVDAHDAEKYSRGLNYLAQNGQLRLELALRGHKFVENVYGKERLINDIKTLYRQLVAG
jgi:glycosyltransferase involved in cell wall biosynthesis